MAYATSADLLKRKDWRDIGDLVADDGTQVAEVDLASDGNLSVALSAASGDINAALLRGGRYTVADLEALTGDAAEYLKTITCEIAMCYLFRRRPSQSLEELEYYEKLRSAFLDRLASGEDLFAIDGNLAASRLDVRGPTVADLENVLTIRTRAGANYFPRLKVPRGNGNS